MRSTSVFVSTTRCGNPSVRTLRTDSIDLSIDFLQQKVDASTDRSTLVKEALELVKMTRQAHEFFGYVGAVRQKCDFHFEPARVERALRDIFEQRGETLLQLLPNRGPGVVGAGLYLFDERSHPVDSRSKIDAEACAFVCAHRVQVLERLTDRGQHRRVVHRGRRCARDKQVRHRAEHFRGAPDGAARGHLAMTPAGEMRLWPFPGPTSPVPSQLSPVEQRCRRDPAEVGRAPPFPMTAHARTGRLAVGGAHRRIDG